MNFAVCDIEARDWTKFVVMGYFDGQKFLHFGKMAAFFEFLGKEKNVPEKIFAHFGGQYDFLFILHHAFAHGYRVESIIPRGSGILCFSVSIGRRMVTFYDSSALLSFSLRRLTEAFQVEHKKGEIDYLKIRKITPELLEYLKSDCIGLHEVLARFWSEDFIYRSGEACTIASQAMKVMQTFLTTPLHSCPDDIDPFVRAGYFGGRTEIFRPLFLGNKEKLLHCYDVNSLYPTMMHDLEFPNAFKRRTKNMQPSALGFYEATVTVPKNTYMPILPAKHKGKLLFPVGRFRGTWSSMELRYAEECGAKIERIHAGFQFKNGGRIFKDFVSSVYKIRCDAPKDSVQNMIAKLILNSSYGKLAVRRDKEKVVPIDGANFYRGAPWREFQCGKKTVQLVTEESWLKGFSNVAMGAWVTAGGRIHLHRLMTPIRGSIYYMDTDSIFTTENLPSGNGLGELKKEYSVERACFLLPKTYITVNTVKEVKATMKGFDRKKLSRFTFDDFHSTLNGEMGLLKVDGEKKFAKFKTASRKGNLLVMVEGGKKEIRTRYDKRIMFMEEQKTGQVSPWNTRPVEIKEK